MALIRSFLFAVPFAVTPVQLFSQFSTGQVIGTDVTTVRAIATGDLDGDGDLDVVYAKRLFSSAGDMYWCANDGTGAFGAPQYIHYESYIVAIAVDDVDADGDMDVLCVANESQLLVLYLNNGTGTEWQRSLLATAVNAPALALGDLDGDEDPDVVVGSSTSGSNALIWRRNVGNGGFTSPTLQIDENSYQLQCLRVADIDDDGDNDVVGAFGLSYQLGWYPNAGNGSFGPRQVINGAEEFESPYGMDVADLDGDGDLDVVVHVIMVYGAQDLKLAWYANDGTGQFGPQQLIDIANRKNVHACDVDNNGTIDIISGGMDGVRWYSNNGAGHFSPPHFVSDDKVDALATGDLDMDGDPDIEYGDDLTTPPDSADHVGWYENFVGSPYRIEGTVFVDEDGSGSPSADDAMVHWLGLWTDPFVTSPYTDQLGNYTAHVVGGSYEVHLADPGPFWMATPPVHSVILSDVQPVSTGHHFKLSPVIDTTVISPAWTMHHAPCGWETSIWITYKNEGTRVEQGTVTFVLDSLYDLISSQPPPVTQAGDTLTWAFDTLDYFEMRAICLIVEKPPVEHIGDTTHFQLQIAALNDASDTLGIFTVDSTDVYACAIDPNEKRVSPTGYGALNALSIAQPYLDYTIHFQNTGTAPAFRVMLFDRLSPDLDHTTLQILAMSHEATEIAVEQGGLLNVLFDNIMLPDSGADFAGSQGFITFRIDLKDSLANLSAISNFAEIYFDENEAVITDTVLTTLVDCDLFEATIDWVGIDTLQANEADVYQWFLNEVVLPGANEQRLNVTEPGAYVVVLTNVYGCELVSQPYQVINTGLGDGTATVIQVIPNPFRDQTRLIFHEPIGNNSLVELIDIHGRVVRVIRVNGTREVSIQRGDLPVGVYVASISGTDGSTMRVRLVAD